MAVQSPCRPLQSLVLKRNSTVQEADFSIHWEVDGLSSTNAAISGQGITLHDVSSSLGTVESNLTACTYQQHS